MKTPRLGCFTREARLLTAFRDEIDERAAFGVALLPELLVGDASFSGIFSTFGGGGGASSSVVSPSSAF